MDYKSKLEQFRGQRDSIDKLLVEEMSTNDFLSQKALDVEMAQDIIQLVGRQTQEGLSFHIENVVTAALEYIMPNPYKFKLTWDTKNNRTQAEMSVERDGLVVDPQDDAGGTVNDIISVALRIAVWSLAGKAKTSPVFILDEPGKFVSMDIRPQFSLFLKEMCDRLNLQIITATHSENLIDGSDNVIQIVKKGNESMIRRAI